MNFYKLIRKRQPNFLNGQDKDFIKEDIQMTNKHIERCSNKENAIKSTIISNTHSVQWLKLKRQIPTAINNCIWSN